MFEVLKRFGEQIKKNPVVYALAFFAFSLPFDHVPTKQISGLTIKLSAVLAIVVIGLGLRHYKQLFQHLTMTRCLLVLWLLWVSSGLLYAANVHAAVKVIVPLVIFGGSAIAVSLLYKSSYQKKVVSWLLLGALVACVFGVYQFVGNRLGVSNSLTGIRTEYSWERFGFPRMESVALEPLYFSAYLLLPLALLTSLFLKNKQHQTLPIMGLLSLLLICDFLTLSRGGIAAAAVMIGIILLQNRRYIREWFSLKKVGYMLIGFIIVIALGVGAIAAVSRKGNDADLTYNKTGVQTLVSHLTNLRFFANKQNLDKKDSIGERDIARTRSVQILKHSPRTLIFGVGAGQDASTKQIQSYGEPNNLTLELLLQYGLVGTLLFALFIAFILKDLWQTAKTPGDDGLLARSLFAYIVAIVLQAQTFSGLALPHLWFGLGLAMALGAQKRLYKKRTT